MDMTTLVKDDKMIVYISGEIDHHTSREIRESIDKMIVMQRPATLILDLEGIDFMDSSGLGLILGRYKKIRELNGNMYICGANDRTMKILKMAGVDKIIKSVECPQKNDNRL